jgi:P-type Mg2+ transporter
MPAQNKLEPQNTPLISLAGLSVSETLKKFRTDLTGLSQTESENRLKKFGLNVLNEEKKLHVFFQFLTILRNPIILILCLVALVSYFMGESVNAFMIFIMILLSVILNFIQEYKASIAARKLIEKVATRATILRDGKPKDILTSEICPGDIVELNAGDLIPADSRVITAKDFFVNQSNITGESFPVEKFADDAKSASEDLIDLTNIVFAGTSVVTGTALAVIVKTGTNTQFGRIAAEVVNTNEENDFTKGIHKFSVLILRIVLTFVLVIFLINALVKHDVLQAFAFSIAVTVGLTPEFLPMIMAVTMAKGSVQMAKRGVIVKRLTAIPSFGSMDVLATDKTGTLTQAHIRLIKYVDISGKNADDVLLYSYLNSFFQTGISNPMDDAILSFRKVDKIGYQKIDEIPFDFGRKRLSVIVEKNRQRYIVTKGAPEEIFKVTSTFTSNGKLETFSPTAKDKAIKLYQTFSRDGYRVLAVAMKKVDPERKIYEKDDEKNMILIGFAAFLDPAKTDAKEAISRLNELGVEVKIVTGDNELVTEKIAHDVGLTVKGILLGKDIHLLNDEALSRLVEKTTIFARFSPHEKARVISALQRNGHVVGYVGDGINDATSLSIADVGISVSNAVDVAKETADIILTNKSLHELKDGVVEGRKTFGNTMKYILMGLSSNFGNMFSVLGAVILLPFLPMLPIQILLTNFLYDVSQLTIPSDNVDEEYIKRPKRWNMKYIRNFMLVFGPISSLFDFTTYGFMFLLFKSSASSFQTGWFMESLATQTLVIHIIRTRKIPFRESNASKLLLFSTSLAVLVGWIIPSTPLAPFFGLSPLPLPVISYIGLIVVIYLLTAEIGKRIFYKHYSN